MNYTLNQAYQDNVSVFASECPAIVFLGRGVGGPLTLLMVGGISAETMQTQQSGRSVTELNACRLPPGVIFQTNKDGTLPPHVLYKVRQNSSLTEKTNEIRRAYWRPGPNTGGKFYFLYGFVWIQGTQLISLRSWPP